VVIQAVQAPQEPQVLRVHQEGQALQVNIFFNYKNSLFLIMQDSILEYLIFLTILLIIRYLIGFVFLSGTAGTPGSAGQGGE
jgi:hypothetical protein